MQYPNLWHARTILSLLVNLRSGTGVGVRVEIRIVYMWKFNSIYFSFSDVFISEYCYRKTHSQMPSTCSYAVAVEWPKTQAIPYINFPKILLFYLLLSSRRMNPIFASYVCFFFVVNIFVAACVCSCHISYVHAFFRRIPCKIHKMYIFRAPEITIRLETLIDKNDKGPFIFVFLSLKFPIKIVFSLAPFVYSTSFSPCGVFCLFAPVYVNNSNVTFVVFSIWPIKCYLCVII